MGKLEIVRTAIRPRPIDNRQSTQNEESNSQLAFNLSAKVIIFLYPRAFHFTFLRSATLFLAFEPCSALVYPRLSPSLGGLPRHFSPRNGRHRAPPHLLTLNRLNFNPLSVRNTFSSLLKFSLRAKSRNLENQTCRLLYIIPHVQNKTRQLLHETPRLFAKTSGLSKPLPPLIMYFSLL